MILLIDNYDSFVYNLYQYIARIDPEVRIVRNDAISPEEVSALKPDAVVLSPGPGRPSDAGVCIELIRRIAGKIPILGVCLGHQAIAEAFGASVAHAKKLMHGKTSILKEVEESRLFRGIEGPIQVARYHSLAVREDTLPPQLKVTARTDDKEIMAMEHREYPIYGLQFHPESILTPKGFQMIENFIGQQESSKTSV